MSFNFMLSHNEIIWSPEILEHTKRKSATVCIFSPFICHNVIGLDAIILSCFKPVFHFPLPTLIKRLSSSLLSASRVVSSAYLRRLISLPAILVPACDSFSQAFSTIYSAYGLLYSSWGSHGKYTGMVCHFLLWWIMFCQNSLLWPVHLGWPCVARLIASLSYASPFAMTRRWSMKGVLHVVDPFSTTQQMALHMDLTKWSLLKSNWLHSL